MQRITSSLLTVTLLAALFTSCQKNDEEDGGDGCSPGIAVTRQITDKAAVVNVIGSTVYLVEQGAIDTRLVPCNLPAEFVQNNLPVIISGDVKATPQNGGPCCTDNFFITKITR